MEVEVYTMENRKFRFSFMGEANQIALGLDKLLPDPRLALREFNQTSGILTFDLGREGHLLRPSEGPARLGFQMRATVSGETLGIQGVYGQPTLAVALRHVAPGRFEFVMPRSFYELCTDVLPGL